MEMVSLSNFGLTLKFSSLCTASSGTLIGLSADEVQAATRRVKARRSWFFFMVSMVQDSLGNSVCNWWAALREMSRRLSLLLRPPFFGGLAERPSRSPVAIETRSRSAYGGSDRFVYPPFFGGLACRLLCVRWFAASETQFPGREKTLRHRTSYSSLTTFIESPTSFRIVVLVLIVSFTTTSSSEVCSMSLR